MTHTILGMHYDGVSADALASVLDVPRVVLAPEVDSTMDEVHTLAASGAPSGTIVIAEQQRRGRGRGGREWSSPAGRGIWMTVLERPLDPSAIDVLSLRVGMRSAVVLERFAGVAVQLKWPNDLLVGGRKLAGILIEARWRGPQLEWVAIGIGVNVSPPAGLASAAALGAVSRVEVLAELVPAIRAASRARGSLSTEERAAFGARDWAAGRRVVAPAVGVVRGITATGALLVEDREVLHTCASGSLILEEASP